MAPMYSEEVQVQCPYCFETITLVVDASNGSPQEYVEDCEVCCKPMQILAEETEEGKWKVSVDRS